jgi:hypothetical protein
MSTIQVKEISAPAGSDIKIASGKTLDLNSQGTVVLPTIPSSKMPTGSVLQVVSLNTGTYFNTSATTPQVTPLTLSITPASSANKVLIKISANGFGTAGSTSTKVKVQLFKNGTHIQWMSDYWGYGQAVHSGSFTWERLDSPGTTSSTTYAMYMASDGGTNCDFNNWGGSAGNTTSTITLMEIAG